jgi:hypothetical protein
MNYKNKTVYVIEIKFSTSEIKSYVIEEMEKSWQVFPFREGSQLGRFSSMSMELARELWKVKYLTI